MAQILIVEDEQALHEAYKMILEKENHTVYSAFNGQEALDVLGKETPDLILLDLRMPKMNGLDFLRKFDKQSQNIKIIIFSNFDAQQEIEEAYKLGADRYILKAWASPKELVKVVNDELVQEEA